MKGDCENCSTMLFRVKGTAEMIYQQYVSLYARPGFPNGKAVHICYDCYYGGYKKKGYDQQIFTGGSCI